MNIFNTEILNENDESAIKKAAKLLNEDMIVGIPTETVYGLGANALSPAAVEKIFKAKGRPADNPLIVHVNSIEMAKILVKEMPQSAIDLFEKFSPGPLTIILKKADIIPDIVSAGLDTVAIRIPSHKGARKIIEQSNLPIAAPSANTSGKPSPTTAQCVFEDMNGKIPLIIDGGNCDVGVESTVISLAGDEPILLRPGFITPENIESVIGKIKISNGVLSQIKDNEKVISPGMKYKHYAPKCDVIIIESDLDNFIKYVKQNHDDNTIALCFEDEQKQIDFIKTINFGKHEDEKSHAANLFSALRKADELKASKLYARAPKKTGVDLAVYNRLLRAAAFTVIKL